jgi:hypothetical protein
MTIARRLIQVEPRAGAARVAPVAEGAAHSSVAYRTISAHRARVGSAG